MNASSGSALPPLLAAVDEVVTSWPDVRGKSIFGHRGWVCAGTMLGFFAGAGVSVKALDGQHSADLYSRPGVAPFIYNGAMEMKGWPVLPIEDQRGVDAALSELKRVYDSVTS